MNNTTAIVLSSFGIIILGVGVIVIVRQMNRRREEQIVPPVVSPNGNGNGKRVWTKSPDYVPVVVTPPYTTNDFPLKKGSGDIGKTQKRVTLLQQFLNNNGANLRVDGKFGNKTEKALKEWQGGAQLTVNGIMTEIEFNQYVTPTSI